MKNLSILLLLIAFTGFSCSSVAHNIFKNQSPRERYVESIEDSPEGIQWLAASRAALEQAQSIQLPFTLKGHFNAEKARSLGLKFKAKRGEQVNFVFNKKPASGIIYAELFAGETVFSTSPLFTADTASSVFNFDIETSGEYILRLQPELFRQGDYELVITSGPSLGFPVSGNKARIGSFWGADRDGGKRSHEGIDIFAAKRTPAIAAADGIITNVKEGGIGGKVVWLRTKGKNLSLYYAHLDEQLVRAGQEVKKGEVIGLVGNTGNARTTPAHLHFGIYTYGGAIDPLHFVKENHVNIPEVPEKDISGIQLKFVKAQKSGTVVIKPDTVADAVGMTSKGYIAELEDGIKMIIPFSAVRAIQKKSNKNIVGQPAGSVSG